MYKCFFCFKSGYLKKQKSRNNKKGRATTLIRGILSQSSKGSCLPAFEKNDILMVSSACHQVMDDLQMGSSNAWWIDDENSFTDSHKHGALDFKSYFKR